MMTAGQVRIEGKEGASANLPLLQDFSTTGHVKLGSHPDGWVKARLRGLDLRGIRGLADKKGVHIDSGVLDVGGDARLKPSGQIPMHVDLSLNDLSLTQSSDNFLSKTLSLTIPLDVAIYLLEGREGSIHLTLPYTLEQGHMSSHQVHATIIRAATEVIAKALARSPLKVGQIVADTGGLLAGKSDHKAKFETFKPTLLTYGAGTVVLSESQRRQLHALEEAMHKNHHLTVIVHHTLGEGDIQMAQRFVNPDSRDREALYDLLQHQRTEILAQRVALASRTTAAYSAGDLAEAQQLSADLSKLEGHTGMIDQAMDNLLEMMGSSGQHLMQRRTRQGALTLARARLNMLRDALLRFDVKSIESRMHIAQPSYVVPDSGQPGMVSLTLTGRQMK